MLEWEIAEYGVIMPGKKRIIEGFGQERKHYCPECRAKNEAEPQEMKPVMLMPKKKIVFRCTLGHQALRGQTILQ